MPKPIDIVRNPVATLTSLAPAPQPGTRAFRVWKRMTDLNVAVYRRTGGRIGGSFDGAPVLLLHHRGRKSGAARVTPLLYMPDGERMIIVASMGGIPRHPAWYLNLTAAPDTEVEVRRRRIPVHARTADSGEKAELWPRLVDLYGAYATYQERTTREIPVVVLEPR